MVDGSIEADALFEKAAARLVGRSVPRDLPEARRLLEMSAALGSEDAALLDIALTANGSGAPASWQGAFEKLGRLRSTSETARKAFALLSQMDLDTSGAPTLVPRAQSLSALPEVRVCRALFTTAECAHIAMAATELLRPSVVVDPSTGREVAHPIRRSDTAILGPAREDLVVSALNRRIAAVTGTELGQAEPLTILRYAQGGEYRLHHDALPNEPNQRVLTAIVYLNAGYLGGQTSLPAAGIEFRGGVGDLLFFRNCDAAGVPDPLARHCGMPVWRGSKWIATRWIRAHKLDPWAPRHAA